MVKLYPSWPTRSQCTHRSDHGYHYFDGYGDHDLDFYDDHNFELCDDHDFDDHDEVSSS